MLSSGACPWGLHAHHGFSRELCCAHTILRGALLLGPMGRVACSPHLPSSRVSLGSHDMRVPDGRGLWRLGVL